MTQLLLLLYICFYDTVVTTNIYLCYGTVVTTYMYLFL